MPLLLGIDLGTSSVRALLFDTEAHDDAGRTLAVAAREYAVDRPRAGWAEQSPDAWWREAAVAVRQAIDEAGRSDVAAIGFSGQMHGTVLVDEHGHALRPAIIWADGRSAAQVEQLVRPHGDRAFVAITGTLPAVGFLGPTLLWLTQHEPDVVAQAHRVLLPKDWLRAQMTGALATDLSDAAGTALFEVRRGEWADAIIDAAGLPRELLPSVRASTDVAGELTPAAADALGLKAGTPVIMGCADQPATAVGNGIVRVGRASVTIGSGGQIFVPVQPSAGHSLRGDPRLHLFNHAVPDAWYLLGAILSAGLSLRWLRDLTGLQNAPNAYKILSAEAAAVPLGADGLVFLPHLAGERTPHLDPLARGAFVGLSAHHTRGHLARAVMEGVTFAVKQALAIALAISAAPDELIVAGGAAESEVWRQMQADVFGLPLRKSLLSEGASVGAALLAGVGAGHFASVEEACRRHVRLGDATEPSGDAMRQYNDLYERWRTLYPTLRDDMHWLVHFAER